MDIRTSTPIVVHKTGKHPTRITSESPQFNQRLNWCSRENMKSVNKWLKSNFKTNDDSPKWTFNGPRFVDFEKDISDPRDSFFDQRPSLQRISVESENVSKNRLLAPDDEIVDYLKNCSISEIANESDADITITNDKFQNFKGLPQLETSRISRQSFTTVQPFAFELREKERQERKEAKNNYMKLMEAEYLKQKGGLFKSKPAPKFKRSTKENNYLKSIESSSNKKIVKITGKNSAAKVNNNMKNNNNIFQATEKQVSALPDSNNINNPVNIDAKPKIEIKINGKTICEIQQKPVVSKINADNKVAENQKLMIPRVRETATASSKMSNPIDNNNVIRNFGENKQNHANSHKEKKQVWKQKPFQVSLPQRKLYTAQSPKLLTAQRARERQLFDERLKKKDMQLEELRQKELAAKKGREKKEITELRKKLVHKARPAPYFCETSTEKRSLPDPLVPIFVKRRKLEKPPTK